jgi:hypothetical protein
MHPSMEPLLSKHAACMAHMLQLVVTQPHLQAQVQYSLGLPFMHVEVSHDYQVAGTPLTGFRQQHTQLAHTAWSILIKRLQVAARKAQSIWLLGIDLIDVLHVRSVLWVPGRALLRWLWVLPGVQRRPGVAAEGRLALWSALSQQCEPQPAGLHPSQLCTSLCLLRMLLLLLPMSLLHMPWLGQRNAAAPAPASGSCHFRPAWSRLLPLRLQLHLHSYHRSNAEGADAAGPLP